MPQYEMVMDGDLPRFKVATPEYLRKMRDERKKQDTRQQLYTASGKRKKRKGRWA